MGGGGAKNNQAYRMLMRKLCLVCTQTSVFQFAKPNWVFKGGEIDIYCIVLTLHKMFIVHKQLLKPVLIQFLPPLNTQLGMAFDNKEIYGISILFALLFLESATLA